MNRVDKKFEYLRRKKRKAFVAYITAGDPSLAVTERLVHALEKSGVDIVELGVPFSDPMADGPTIQRASQRSLKRGTNLDSIAKIVKSIRKKSEIPLVLMTYYNPVFKYGVERFVKVTKNAGVDGVIIPDLPPEEAGPLVRLARGLDYSCVFLLAPTSTVERIRLAAKMSSGFIYYVSLTGVTGARKKLPQDLEAQVRKVKKISGKPVCVGFGVSTREHARRISGIADGIIVGSAIINVIEKNLGKKGLVKRVSEFVSRLAN